MDLFLLKLGAESQKNLNFFSSNIKPDYELIPDV
jgi:hypothetical protein